MINLHMSETRRVDVHSAFFSEEHVEAYVDLPLFRQVTAIDYNQKIII